MNGHMRQKFTGVRAPGAVLALLMVVTPAIADAPPDQYAPFSRDSAEIQDLQTGLTWQHRATLLPAASGAVAACNIVGPGFRPPTIRELLTLFDDHSEIYRPALVSIDQAAFGADAFDLPYFASDVGDVPLGVRFQEPLGDGPIVGVVADSYLRCVKSR